MSIKITLGDPTGEQSHHSVYVLRTYGPNSVDYPDESEKEFTDAADPLLASTFAVLSYIESTFDGHLEDYSTAKLRELFPEDGIQLAYTLIGVDDENHEDLPALLAAFELMWYDAMGREFETQVDILATATK